jgi:hypothetical protein
MRFLRTDDHAPPTPAISKRFERSEKIPLRGSKDVPLRWRPRKRNAESWPQQFWPRNRNSPSAVPRGRQSRTRTRSHICCVARWDQLLEKAKQLEALATERANAITQAAKGRQLHDERESHIRHIRQKNEGAVHRLSQRFDAVIRELVPGEIEGAVIIDGKGITLKVSQDGERSTLQLNRSRSWPLTLRRSSLLWRVPQLSLDFFCTTAPEKPT